MNKKQFIYYFNQVTLDESLESQIELLEKMQKVWIPNLIERKTRNYTFCESCKKYVRTKSFKEIEKEKWVSDVCIYHDAGYGDSDEYADVLYLFKYSVCPNCGFKEVISKTPLETKNKRDRWGEKI